MVRLTDCFDMTIAVDWDVKPQAKQNKQSTCELKSKMSDLQRYSR